MQYNFDDILLEEDLEQSADFRYDVSEITLYRKTSSARKKELAPNKEEGKGRSGEEHTGKWETS